LTEQRVVVTILLIQASVGGRKMTSLKEVSDFPPALRTDLAQAKITELSGFLGLTPARLRPISLRTGIAVPEIRELIQQLAIKFPDEAPKPKKATRSPTVFHPGRPGIQSQRRPSIG
jgi:hypothetical protein